MTRKHRLLGSTIWVISLAALASSGGCGSSMGSAAEKFEASSPGSMVEYERAAARPALSAATAATPPALTPPAADAVSKPATELRQVIYSASYKVVVADVAGTLQSIQTLAEKLGGYMQEVAGGSITFRIPAARFNDACKVVESAGEVVDRQVKAQDVTEEMRDLHIRLDNAEKLRERLLAILAKLEKVEDALKVEAELARVSGEIDAAKGKIRFLESRLAMSVIRVDLNSPVLQNARGVAKLPFEWVEQLGDGLTGQLQQTTRKAGFFNRGPSFTPPTGFVRYFEDSDEADGMDANGLLLRVHRHQNLDQAQLAFWGPLARKQLVESRSLSVMGEENDGNSYVLRGVRDNGGKPIGYLLSIRRSNRGVIVFEAWGPADLVDKNVNAIRASALSTDPG